MLGPSGVVRSSYVMATSEAPLAEGAGTLKIYRERERERESSTGVCGDSSVAEVHGQADPPPYIYK